MNSTMLPTCHASSTRFTAAIAESGRRWNIEIKVNEVLYRVKQVVIDIHSIRAGNIVTWTGNDRMSMTTCVTLPVQTLVVA